MFVSSYLSIAKLSTTVVKSVDSAVNYILHEPTKGMWTQTSHKSSKEMTQTLHGSTEDTTPSTSFIEKFVGSGFVAV